MNQNMLKIFNIEGPGVSRKHYMLPALDRLLDVRALIADERYFVLHAPRQSGKKTFITALANEINKKSQYYTLSCLLQAL